MWQFVSHVLWMWTNNCAKITVEPNFLVENLPRMGACLAFVSKFLYLLNCCEQRAEKKHINKAIHQADWMKSLLKTASAAVLAGESFVSCECDKKIIGPTKKARLLCSLSLLDFRVLLGCFFCAAVNLRNPENNPWCNEVFLANCFPCCGCSITQALP